ncbi:unnamed protein product [Ectocarpus sp. CCAP 1310/34]|nr:unnamed protein product [Ectocarpus sp. CCAP 1310/34]
MEIIRFGVLRLRLGLPPPTGADRWMTARVSGDARNKKKEDDTWQEGTVY